MKECKRIIELINDYFDEGLESFKEELMFAHIKKCPLCLREYEEQKKTIELYSKVHGSNLEEAGEMFKENVFLAELNERIDNPSFRDNISSSFEPIRAFFSFLNTNLIQNKLVLSLGIVLIVIFNVYFLFFTDFNKSQSDSKIIYQGGNLNVIYSSDEYSVKDFSDSGVDIKYKDKEDEKTKKPIDKVIRIDL